MISIYDLALVVAVYIYVIALIYVSELLRRAKNLPSAFTRRMIHFFAGDSIINKLSGIPVIHWALSG